MGSAGRVCDGHRFESIVIMTFNGVMGGDGHGNLTRLDRCSNAFITWEASKPHRFHHRRIQGVIGKLRLRAHICQDMSLAVAEIGGHLKPTCHQQIISRDLRPTGVFGLAEPLRKMRDDDKQARNPKWDFPSLPTIT
ncbi:hypothetical protein B296_00020056 [Ensete ventricosum]|uniref:Uncharacterized protein n=1 Tax=Ensete ventricosum TaxID=4639 RepID=A0A426XYB9_ENSVE|nr:hypothetical protein B296_00020056 [Ensete ventricosum]